MCQISMRCTINLIDKNALINCLISRDDDKEFSCLPGPFFLRRNVLCFVGPFLAQKFSILLLYKPLGKGKFGIMIILLLVVFQLPIFETLCQ